MTRQEVILKLKNYCADQEKNNGWWIFKKHILKFDKTFLQEQHNRTANLSLPDTITFGSGLTISKAGILYKSILNKWSNVVGTIVKSQIIPINDNLDEKHYFLIFALISGDVFEVEIDIIDKYFGQLGHFIEQYKISETANL